MATHIYFAEFPECDVVNTAFCRHRHCRAVSRIGNLFSFHCAAMKSDVKMAADVIIIRKRLITRAFLDRVQNGEEPREAAKRTSTVFHSSVSWFLCVAIRRHASFSFFPHGITQWHRKQHVAKKWAFYHAVGFCDGEKRIRFFIWISTAFCWWKCYSRACSMHIVILITIGERMKLRENDFHFEAIATDLECFLCLHFSNAISTRQMSFSGVCTAQSNAK